MNKKLPKKSVPKIWVLVDNRIGNANQALALATRLNIKYEVKNISYNNFGKLPNCLLKFYPLHIKRPLFNDLIIQEKPDIIISSGRRTAPLAIYLKKFFGNKSKIIQIMRPDLIPEIFDLVILPQHDNYAYNSPNIFRIIGALNDIQNQLTTSAEKIHNHYPDLKKFMAVLIGGSNKKYNFSIKDAKSLIQILKNLYSHHSLSLFISFSRRTPTKIKKLFKNEFLWPHIIYDPEEDLPNPYPEIIGAADYIITTADSISMCSEAAGTGKPIYIFCPKNFKLIKHKFFIQQLVDLGIVKILDENIEFLTNYEYTPLREVNKVVEMVKKSFFT